MRPVFIKTFGCKVNYADSMGFADLLRDAGFSPLEISGGELPDSGEVERPVVFVNGCCVTLEAERKAAQFIRRVKREHPDGEVLLSGCSARNFATRKSYELAGARVFSFYPEAFEWVRENVEPVDAFVGTGLALSAVGPDVRTAAGGGSPTTRPDVRATADSLTVVPTQSGIVTPSRARAFLKVQDGCHNCCTFCIIPFVRPYASRPLPEVLAEARRRLAEGCRELVLTGVNIGNYGATPIAPVHEIVSQQHFRRSRLYQPVAGHPTLWDLVDVLLHLLESAYADEGIDARLRVSSIEPEEIDPRFFAQLAHPRMCPHLHLPLQSGSDAVLGAMRRLYDVETYMRRVEAFRAACPDGALTTDIITGFPGETEADFEQTLALCELAGFERVHGFPFSPRPGTRAAQLPQLPSGAAQRRNRALIAHCRGIADSRWRRFVGQAACVLVEERQDGHWFGHGAAYQEARIPAHPGDGGLAGQMADVRLDSYADGVFTASIL